VEAASKAAGFTTTAIVIAEDTNNELWQRYLLALSPATRGLVERPPVAVSWLPIGHFAELIDTALDVVYSGKEDRMVAVSRRSIFRDLNSLYRMFVRMSTPMFVMERAAKIWDKYNLEHGEMLAEPTGKNEARVTIRNVSIGSNAFWAYQRGAIHATLDATGYASGKVDMITGGGRSNASFRVTW
jgi:hypothetical protein